MLIYKLKDFFLKFFSLQVISLTKSINLSPAHFNLTFYKLLIKK